MKQEKCPAGMRRLLVVQGKQKYGDAVTQTVVTFPSTWKVTFGPVCPGSKGGDNGGGALALRVYKSDKDQYACFTDVRSFRDLDQVTIQEIVTKVTTKSKTSSDSKGNSRGSHETTVHEEAF